MNRFTFFGGLVVVIALSNVVAEAQWEQVSLPGVPGVPVYSVCVRDSELFAGTEGTVYVSKDNGAYWQATSLVPPARDYNSEVTYLASDGDSIIAVLGRTGIFLSSDGGADWRESVVPDTTEIPEVIARSGPYILAGAPTYNAYRSTDDGRTWTTSSQLYWLSSVAMEDSFAVAVTEQAILFSSDYGATWDTVRSAGTGPVSQLSAVAISGSLAVVSIPQSSGACTVMVSSDRGKTWSLPVYNIPCTSLNAFAFVRSGSGSSYVFAATDSGVFRSSDNGEKWSSMSNGLGSDLVYSLAIDSLGIDSAATIYAATGDGIFKSTDYGGSWTSIGNPAAWKFAASGSDLFAATSNAPYDGLSWVYSDNTYKYVTSIIHSTDNGTHWTEVFHDSLNMDTQAASLFATMGAGGNIVLFVTGPENAGLNPSLSGSVVLVSTDGGARWDSCFYDPVRSSIKLFSAMSKIFASSASQTGNGSLFVSTDDGQTWTKSDTAYVTALSAYGGDLYSGALVTTFVQSPTRPVVPWIASYVFVSHDSGSSWNSVADSLLPASLDVQITSTQLDTISVLTSLYADGSNILIGTEANGFSVSPVNWPYAEGGGVFILDREDSGWAISDSTLIGRQTFTLEGVNSNIFAGTDAGVCRSVDNGTTWTPVNDGLPHPDVWSLFTSGQDLFASTSDGLWESPVSLITAVENSQSEETAPSTFTLDQNYPNPFNPTTNIGYRIADVGLVTLKVYNVLGQLVKTLVKKVEQPGSYEVQFNGSGLASGVYFYRLRSGNYVKTMKLMLLK